MKTITCKINLNQELNGIELLFDAKPSADTLAAVKAQGFRWSNKNKLWYAKQTAERLSFAQSLGSFAPASAPCVEKINLDNLGVKPENFSFYGADLAKFIRSELKARGVKGATVRANRSGYTTSITVTVKATAEDMASIEEAAERHTMNDFVHDINRTAEIYTGGRWLFLKDFEAMTEEEKEGAYYNYLSEQINKISSVQFGYTWASREHYFEFTADFWDKLTAIYEIANQWNYCNDDLMTDYFDRGYYLDIEIKKADDFQPRATMTETERAAYAAEIRAKEEQEEAWRIAYEEEQKQRTEEAAKYKAWEEAAVNAIYSDVTIKDLPDNEQFFVDGLIGGIGKECSLEELKKYINEHTLSTKLALISRIVTFNNEQPFNDFCKLFLNDFSFLEHMGGTGSEDIRLKDYKHFLTLNKEQRESIDFYSCNCVAVYFGSALQFVINPEGYSYARYVYLPTEETKTTAAAGVLENMRKASENKTAFYIPAPVEEQAENITAGDEITIYQCDGWILNNVYAGSGRVVECKAGNYAQYSGVYIDLVSGRKQKKVFIRNDNKCLIYKGIKPALPESITRRRVSANMYELLNYNELIPNIYKYYQEQGEEPVIDTWQR